VYLSVGEIRRALFRGMFPAFRGEIGWRLSSPAERGSHRPGETTDAEKETESGGFLKSGSGKSLTLRRRKGKTRSL